VRIGKGFLQGRLRWGIALAGSVALLVGAAAALGFGKFKAPQRYPVGSGAYPVRIADFNRDGKRDVVVGNENDDNVSVLLGKGTGKLKATHNFPAGALPFGIAVGDFDRDGKKDLVVVNYSSDRVSILLGNGDGSFQAPIPHPVGDVPYYVAIGKFNADNRQDLAVAANTGAVVSILLGQPGGDFGAPVDYPTGTDATSVAVADFNHDGDQDVMALTYSGGYRLFMGNGNGTFDPPLSTPSGTNEGEGMVVGEFNGDHAPDIAANNCESLSADGRVYVRQGLGDGTFTGVRTYTAGSCAYQPGAADVNRDGNLDILMSNDDIGTVDVLRGKGDGRFKPVRRFPATRGENFSVAAGRLNADKGPDLAVPDYDHPKVAILLNKP
jgi:hypothetical protein